VPAVAHDDDVRAALLRRRDDHEPRVALAEQGVGIRSAFGEDRLGLLEIGAAPGDLGRRSSRGGRTRGAPTAAACG
jgi:hypothetical protein